LSLGHPLNQKKKGFLRKLIYIIPYNQYFPSKQFDGNKPFHSYYVKKRGIIF
jgi:hypothetical protein